MQSRKHELKHNYPNIQRIFSWNINSKQIIQWKILHWKNPPLKNPPRPPYINPPPPKEEENSFDEPAKINISSIRRENSTPIWQLLNSLKLKILFQYHMLTQNHDNNLEIFHRNISWTKGTETKVGASREVSNLSYSFGPCEPPENYQYYPICGIWYAYLQ